MRSGRGGLFRLLRRGGQGLWTLCQAMLTRGIRGPQRLLRRGKGGLWRFLGLLPMLRMTVRLLDG